MQSRSFLLCMESEVVFLRGIPYNERETVGYSQKADTPKGDQNEVFSDALRTS